MSSATTPASLALRAAIGALAVQAPVEHADEAAHPGDGMADRAREPVRITEHGLDQQRQQREWGGHDPPRRARAARPWRRSRCRAEAVSRRARTFPRPVDRDQSQSLPGRRNFRPISLRACLSPVALAALAAIAAKAYGAPSADPCGGSARLADSGGADVAVLLARGRAAVLAPTYAEHARVAELAGHNVVEVAEVGQLRRMPASPSSSIPNNPDGRIVAKDALLALADRLRRRGGLLLVDEAFMDVGRRRRRASPTRSSTATSSCCALSASSMGFAGLRLSFALASPQIAARLAAALGPWPVSGAALAIGAKALADTAWRETTRSLARRARRAARRTACRPRGWK